MSCGTPLQPLEKGSAHDCKKENLKRWSDGDWLTVKGVDYQICPNDKCKKRWNLDSGCNSLRCVCRTHFCYICGEKARHDSDHWRKGRCPQYNQPGTAKVQHDDHEAPLLLHPDVKAAAAHIRGEAETATSAPIRQAKLDEAICVELLGNIHEHSVRAHTHVGNVAVIWSRNWHKLAEDVVRIIKDGLEMYKLLDSLITGRTIGDELERQEMARIKAMAEEKRSVVDPMLQWFITEYPAEMDLLETMRSLVERTLRLGRDVEATAEKWLTDHSGAGIEDLLQQKLRVHDVE
ncbi:hypothetical protein LTR86_001264 [Recurvomyces mirabilis]|nr:hypothetical protein LTR86_001264 [Recurvomyces mirabilis]